MADAPKYRWQEARNEALYVEDETGRILGFYSVEPENRSKIDARGVSGKAAKEFSPLGLFTTEKAAKLVIEENVAKLFPPPPPEAPAKA